MARIPYRRQLIRKYLFHCICRDVLHGLPDDLEERFEQSELDLTTLLLIQSYRYLVPRIQVPKLNSLALLSTYLNDESTHPRFTQMLHLTPEAFHHVLWLIQDHPIFVSTGRKPQAPVEQQLSVTLYRLGRYGNGASIQDVARLAGISEGSVLKYTARCLEAILSLEPHVMRQVTPEEKETEKAWVEEQVGCSAFRDGWCTGDGTLCPLSQKPGLNGQSYYSRHGDYDLNVQVRILLPSLIQILTGTKIPRSSVSSQIFGL